MKKNYFFSSVVALAVVIGFSACDQDLPEMVEANDVEVAATSGELRSAMLWDDGFGFHCNNAKGNGRTDVTINGITFRANNQNDNGGNPAMHATLFRVGETTVWRLEPINGVIVCATCGRTDWVTYSNKNGVINGKNIQAHHPRPGEVPPPVEPEPIEFVVEFLNYKVIPASGELEAFEQADSRLISVFTANEVNGFTTEKPPYENPNVDKYEFAGWNAFEDGQLLPSPTTASMLQNIDKDMVVFAVFTPLYKCECDTDCKRVCKGGMRKPNYSCDKDCNAQCGEPCACVCTCCALNCMERCCIWAVNSAVGNDGISPDRRNIPGLDITWPQGSADALTVVVEDDSVLPITIFIRSQGQDIEHVITKDVVIPMQTNINWVWSRKPLNF